MKYFIILSLVLLQSTDTLSLSLPDKPNKTSTTEYCTGLNHDSYTPYLPPGEPNNDYYQHAMVWKHLINPDIGFNKPPFTGHVTVNDGDSEGLQALETFSSIFFDPMTGENINPSGNWSEIIINDPETAAIFTAISIWAWSTPVYFDFINVPNINPQGFLSSMAVAHCVTLSTKNSTIPPHIACGWDAANAEDMLQQVMSCPELIIEEVELSYFTDYIDINIGAYYVQADPSFPIVDGEVFSDFYGGNIINADKYVVIDPPSFDIDTPLNDIQQILKMSKIMGSQALLRTGNGLVDRRNESVLEEELHRQ